jgi:hypothetical protein
MSTHSAGYKENHIEDCSISNLDREFINPIAALALALGLSEGGKEE